MQRTSRARPAAVAAALILAFVAGPATADLVPGEIVVKTGTPFAGSTVSNLEAPFTDGFGRVGFLGSLADSRRFIWLKTGPVFLSSDALPDVLTGGEGAMGISNDDGWAYSPAFNGNDAIYTHWGKLLAKGDACPPLPGLFSTFNSRPTMTPGGAVYWICGTTLTQGSATSTNRHLFRAANPADPNGIVRVLGGGDVIQGKTVSATAAMFDYWISDNELHHIHVLDMNGTPGLHVYLDGGFVAQLGNPTGDGDNWSDFDLVSVNNDGDYIFTGDTDGPTTADEVLAVNGVIRVREGMTIGGVTLAGGATVRAVSLNNQGYIAHMWGWSSTDEHLFLGHAATLEDSERLLGIGDEIDIDGNGSGDYTVTDFAANPTFGPGLDLASDGFVHVEVSLRDGNGDVVSAILRLGTGRLSATDDVFATGRSLSIAPNPTIGGTEIRFAQPGQEAVARASVFDAAGRLVRTLSTGVPAEGGLSWNWDGRDGRGARVAAGIFFVRVEGAGFTETRRLTVVR